MSPASASRRRVLRRYIENGSARNQQDLVEALATDGFEVTQATVSRDLDIIGAVKVRDAQGQLRYVIPEPEPDRDVRETLARALAEYVESITASANLVVLHTPPGAAAVVAGAIDSARVASVIGTIAGDDTVIAVADDKVGGAGLATELEQIGALL